MSYIMGSKLSFVLEQLSQYSGDKKVMADSTFIICPWHAEQTPSGRVFHGAATRSPGFYKCYGCGHAAKWDELAVHIGLKPFVKQRPGDEFINLGLLEVEQENATEDMLLTELPRNKRWRGIKTSLLTDIGGKLCVINHPEHGYLKPKIYLPILVNDETKGYIKARLTKHDNYPSYINAKGQWSKTHGLFPYDYSISLARKIKSKAMVLVEGPRDALRLLQLGVPAMCILGTQSWSDNKAKLLEIGGITTIVLLMDGDCAGQKASEMLVQKLTSMFKVIEIKLWAIKGSPYLEFKDCKEPSKAAKSNQVTLWDACNCPEWIVQKIKRKYFT